jgi:hypothetical protein
MACRGARRVAPAAGVEQGFGQLLDGMLRDDQRLHPRHRVGGDLLLEQRSAWPRDAGIRQRTNEALDVLALDVRGALGRFRQTAQVISQLPDASPYTYPCRPSGSPLGDSGRSSSAASRGLSVPLQPLPIPVAQALGEFRDEFQIWD